jgi:hypothetical protein
MAVPYRQVRATYTADAVTVYQAYSAAIADPAVAAGRFVPPFKRDRMTWIKPSFRWMMYRCGWGAKPDQERVLALQIGLSGEAVIRYVDEWIVGVTDVTALAHRVRDLVRAGDEAAAAAALAPERPYPLPAGVAAVIGASPEMPVPRTGEGC